MKPSSHPVRFGRFLLRKRTMYLIFAACSIVAAWILTAWLGDPIRSWDWWEPWVALPTFMTALAIFLSEAHQDYINFLPKRLSIYFLYPRNSEDVKATDSQETNNAIAFFCETAYLAGESDIRQWSQQIGQQMAGQQLNFEPYIQQDPPRREHISDSFEVMHYRVTFSLRKTPFANTELISSRLKEADSESDKATVAAQLKSAKEWNQHMKAGDALHWACREDAKIMIWRTKCIRHLDQPHQPHTLGSEPSNSE